MAPFETVRLTAANARLLDRVAGDVFDEAIDPDRVSAYLREPGHLMLLAVAEGEVIGQVAAIIHHHPGKPVDLYIDEVGVTPAWRRQGVARRMLEQMFAWGRSLGCEQAWVAAEAGNTPARRLYERRGADAEHVVMYQYDL